MHEIAYKYKCLFTSRGFLISTITGFLFLTVSLIVNFYAGHYATVHESNSVTDLVLSNIRTYDVDGIFTYGSITFWLFMIFLVFSEPKRIPFTIKSIALFVLIRSIFITLTHIGPFATQVVVDSNIISKFTFGGDLFFSGHTGLPYLMALLFWEDKRLRVSFVTVAVVFGVVVLLAHLHYSIDVLSAFFITYSIYHISNELFAKDKLLFGS